MNDMAPLITEATKLLVTIAAAWGSVRASLNGARKDISDIKTDVKEIRSMVVSHDTRVAVLEDRQQRVS